MVADKAAKFAPSTDSHQLSHTRERGLMLVGEALLHWPHWLLPFTDCSQERDSPLSAGTVSAPRPNKQVLDKVQTVGPENVSVRSAWCPWSFLAVDNYGVFSE